jgi:NifU-like protein involved in Fe-S cluster formation
MFDEIYNKRILSFAANIPRTDRLVDPEATVTEVSRLCGSRVTVDLKMRNGVVSDFGQEVKACALGQSAASIMARNVIGATVGELRDLRDTMFRMLKEKGPPPTGKWKDLEILAPVAEYAPRHGSVMLVFDATLKAVEQIEGSRAGSQPEHIRPTARV